ncbi:MAG: serine/threonine-protein kinase [Phycisphaerales bacterium]
MSPALAMDVSRHQRLAGLFAELRRLDAVERSRRVDELRAEDAPLAEELESLLRHGERVPASSADAGLGLGDLLAGFDPQRAAGERGADEPPDPGTVPPATIGRYTILRELGEGGMGVVYLAEQDKPKRVVALKLMRQGFGRDTARMRKRFELETQVLGRLEHPGIARIYDAGTAPMPATAAGGPGTVEVPYFAMEYVDGRPLVEYAEQERLGTRERMSLMRRICDAVSAAHRQGVVHRDLKPGNILVDRAGNPKVLDFGVARATGSEVAVTTMHTDIGQLIGTLPYMSPEQIEGDPTRLDARCDVYALGAVAYELLSGRLPLEVRGMSVAQAARVIRDDDPTPLSAVNRVFRGDLETIVGKALEKDRTRRYDSAEQLGADIDRYLREEPIDARPMSRIYQLRKFARRNRGLVAGIVASFVVLALGLAGTTWGLLQASHQRDAAIAAQARAQKRFDEVRRLAKTFIYDVHDGIVDLPGSTKVRKAIVETALSYLDTLAAESGDDPKLQADLAEAYLKVGSAQGYYARGNLGDREGAMASFDKALRIREQLAQRFPDDSDALTQLVSAQNQIANGHYSAGRFEDALSLFQRGLEVRQRLLAGTDPATPQHRAIARAVAISEQWVGNCLVELGRTEESLAAHRRQFDLMKALVEDDGPAAPADGADAPTAEQLAAQDAARRSAQRDLAVAHEKLGDRLTALDRVDDALAEYRASFAIREKLAEAMPENAQARTDLMVSIGKIGSRLLKLGRTEEAGPALTYNRELCLALAAADPADVQAQANVVVASTWIGELCAAKAEAPGLDAASRDALLAEAIEWMRDGIRRLDDLKAAGKLEPRIEVWFEQIGAQIRELQAKRDLGAAAP